MTNPNDEANELLRQADAALSNTISGTAPLTYWYVDSVLWNQVMSLRSENGLNHFQRVTKGQDPYSIAGIAGTWLGEQAKHGSPKRIGVLKIVAHGQPGSFVLGTEVTYGNVAPLGGWLISFFTPDAKIQLISCNAAADAPIQQIGNCNVGQLNPEKPLGYWLLSNLARASQRPVEGSLYAQSTVNLELSWTCRRVKPDGSTMIFNGSGGDPFKTGVCK